VRAFVAGKPETLGNLRQSYLLAFPACGSDGSASVGANRLIRKPAVRARVLELRADAERDARARLRSWWALAPDAQRTLEQAAAGTFDPMPEAPHGVRAEAIRSGVRSAQEILNRAEGTPQQLHELRITAGITVAVAGPGSELDGRQLVELPAEDPAPSLHNGHYVPSSELESGHPARLLAPGGVNRPNVQEYGPDSDGRS